MVCERSPCADRSNGSSHGYAAVAQHTVLRHVYARREHTRLDRGVHVRARGQHSHATGSQAVCTPKATDLERPPFAHVSLRHLRTDTDPPTDPLVDGNQRMLR